MPVAGSGSVTIDAISSGASQVGTTFAGSFDFELQEVTIDGTTLKKTAVNDLLKFRSQYFAWYQQEEQQKKLNAGLSAGTGRLLMRL